MLLRVYRSLRFGKRIFFKDTKSFHTSVCLRQKWQGQRPTYRLVIFDKDGTLTSFDSMWGRWSEYNALKLEKFTGKSLSNDIYQYFNYDTETKKFGKSCVAHDTHDVLRKGILDIMVQNHGIPQLEAESSFEECWQDIFDISGESITEKVEPLGNVKLIFETLKKRSIKIAICSSDQRESVLLAMKTLEIENLVDRTLCGNDPENTPKPAPDNVHLLCQELEVDPQDTVIVGDTYYDTRMGKNSNCGLVIGILSGQSDKEDLKDAHYVTSNLDDVLPLILGEN